MKPLCLWALLFYQRALSHLLPPRCRFYPSCSHYAYAVIQKRGVLRGLLATVHRLLRCHPFSEGGVDEPPLDPVS